MPSLSFLIPYCLLQVFVHSQANHAMELAVEFNPRSQLFKVFSGIGMVGLYGFIGYSLFFVTPWYAALVLFGIGLVINAVVANTVRASRSFKLQLGLVFLGFLGIPACIIALIVLSA